MMEQRQVRVLESEHQGEGARLNFRTMIRKVLSLGGVKATIDP